MTKEDIDTTIYESDILYNAATDSDGKLLSYNNCSYCCLSEKWCFQHTGLASIKRYDNNTNNCCICLDYCTWCLEFRTRKYSICERETTCYLCCCSIYFI